MSSIRKKPLSELLQDRSIFAIFDEEFQKENWLDVTVLVHSECSIDEMLEDGSVPKSVLLRIADRLDKIKE